MFNNYLHFIEIKAVLEGRGFSPPLRSAQTFGKNCESKESLIKPFKRGRAVRVSLWTYPNGES
jgi:hypothetical protein